MHYTPVAEIAQKYGLNRQSIYYHVQKGWGNERLIKEDSLLKEIAANKAPQLLKIRDLSLALVMKGLDYYKRLTRPPTLRECRNLTFILSELDKITKSDKRLTKEPVEEYFHQCDPFKEGE
jgi:hypothetical protein